MKIERVGLGARRYVLRDTLATSRTRLAERRGYAVELVDENGKIGRGEALPLPAAGTEDLAATHAVLRASGARLAGREGELQELLDWVEAGASGAPAASCALDTALHDLEAQRAGQPVAHLLAARPRDSVDVNAVVGSDASRGPAGEAVAAVRRGYRTLKLKVGVRSLDADAALLAAVRAVIPGSTSLRIDSNGAWTVESALAALETLAEFDVDLVEQPVRGGDLEGLRLVSERSPVPVAADEALATSAGRAALVTGSIVPVAILKPMVLGGLRASARLARAAAAAGVRCVVTTTFEGPVGTAAALHLSAALGDPELAHGLAASDMLVAEFPQELVPVRGSLRVRGEPGLLGRIRTPVTSVLGDASGGGVR